MNIVTDALNRNMKEGAALLKKRVSSWGSSAHKGAHKKNHSSQTNTINEQKLATEYSRNLFSEHITANIHGRPQ